MNHCDGCTACCEVLEIDEIILKKPAGIVCPYSCKGCKIYDTRPHSCREFDCVYVLEDSTPLELRPDKTGIIFEKVTTRIYLALIEESQLDNWKTELIENYIRQLNDDGISVVASSHKTGVLDVFNTQEHDREKVLEIVLGIANKWQRHHTQQT